MAPDIGPARATGSLDALEAIYRTHYSALVGLARVLLDDRGQAEEVVQEAFTRTYVAWSRLRTQDDPLPYVRTVVVNLSRSGLRRRRTVRAAHLTPVPDAPAAETLAVASDARRRVADAVARLPRRQRECVALRYLSECSTAQTAVALDLSEGAVKAYLHRGLAALSADLEDMR